MHDVEIIVDEEYLGRAGSILFVNFYERVDAALIVRLGEVPIEVILPEHTWVTFMRKDEGVSQELVIDDRTVAHDIVVLDKRDRLLRAIPH